jgi:hypothetical protein
MVTMSMRKDVNAIFTAVPPVQSLILSANKLSPGLLSTVGNVIFTANASGESGNYEYKFWLKNNTTGIWTVVQNYGASNTWSWAPAAAGSYTIEVYARNARSLVPYDATSAVNFDISAVPPAASVSLTANKPTPGVLGSIGTVTFTALASGGSGTYEYKFWIKDNITNIWIVAQNYSSNKIWNWTPAAAASYTVQVYARNAGSASAVEARGSVIFDITAVPPASTVTLAANKLSPQFLAGAGTITLTANASGGSGTYEYKFWIKDSITNIWTMVQDYGVGNIWNWTPAAVGSYSIQVYARNSGSGSAVEARGSITFDIISIQPASSVALMANKTSPRVLASAGTVTFTANAAGGSGTYEYKFWIKDSITNAWTVVKDYGAGNTWTWTPTAAASYTIQVYARNAGSTSAVEARGSVTFDITSVQPASSVTLTASKASPQTLAGAGTITFTANASGGSGTYEYKFWIKDNITNTWSVVQAYSALNTWSWTPAAAATYTIQVHARNAGSASSMETNSGMTFVITN